MLFVHLVDIMSACVGDEPDPVIDSPVNEGSVTSLIILILQTWIEAFIDILKREQVIIRFCLRHY